MRKPRKERLLTSGKSLNTGFTLIELLTSVAIIATLAGVAMPGINAALNAAKISAATQQAGQVAIGLRAFSMDNGGYFPVGENDYGESVDTSNAAFRDLAEYIDDERIYAVKGSAWGAEVDNRNPYCSAGEVHWSYIAGLDSSSTSWWPLVVDGTDGDAHYVRDKGERGGQWKGKKAIVARVDGSAESIRLRGDDDARYMPRLDEESENALEVGAYMRRGAELLDPEG